MLRALTERLPLPGKRVLDPGRVQRVYREFDVRRGYGAYAQICRERLERALPDALAGSPQAVLSEKGLADFRRLLPASVVKTVLDISALEEARADAPPQPGEARSSLTRRADLADLLDALLTPQLDACLLHYFQAEYLIHTATLTRTWCTPNPPTVSYRWHCDKGPKRHLKLLVYLNDHEEHGGGTEFIGLKDTAAVARRGYLFGWTRRRTGDVGTLEAIAGRPLHVRRRTVGAGDAVLFQTARVLRCGLAPKHGDRLVLTVCFSPSPVPWRDALA